MATEMGSEWYVARGGKTFGPFSLQRLQQGARDGEIAGHDHVWCAGMQDWQLAPDVPQLWQLTQKAQSPPVLQAAPQAEPKSAAAAATDQAPSDAAPKNDEPRSETRPPRRRSGLLARHWRGELRLGIAYWGVGFALTVLVIGLSNALGEWLGRANLSPIPLGITLFSHLSFLCVMSIWQMVGIWRAAGNHTRRTGRRTWALLARAAVLVGVVRLSVDFHTVIGPMLSESAALIAGRENIPPHRLRILRNGTELELAGGMPSGTAEALAKLLNAAAAIRVLHLNSAGGRISEGYEIYRLARDRGLVTYTATDCVSACTIAFLGGTERYLSSQARLGFHSASFGTLDFERLPTLNSELSRILADHGVPRWFIEKALTTSASSMWYPSHEELIAANIVTRIVDPGQFGWSGIEDWRDREALARGLVSYPLYKLIKSNDPGAFNRIVDRFSEALKVGKSQDEVLLHVQAVFHDEILPKYLQVAPDGVIHRYWRTQIAEMEHLSKTDPAACVAYAFPEARAPGFNLNRLLPPSLLADDASALTALIENATTSPSVQKAPALDRELDAVEARIGTRFPAARQILADPTRYFSTPKILCEVVLAYYSDILSMPQSESGPILRALAEPLK